MWHGSAPLLSTKLIGRYECRVALSPTLQIRQNRSGWAKRAVLAGCLLAMVSVPADEAVSESADRDWPCIQRKVPRISVGMVWAGPAISEKDEGWRRDARLSKLVARITAPTTDLAEAEKAVGAFAAGLAADGKVQKLTSLFAGMLATINTERDAVIRGIARYAHRQQRLAARIEQATAELESLPQGDSSPRNDLQRQVDWDTRIFEERERSLAFVCESPVLLEQRAFALARAIMGHLE